MNDFIAQRNLIPGWPDAYPTVHSRLDALDKAGLVHWPTRGSMPSLKRYLDSTMGTAIEDVFTDIGKLEATAKEKTGYPTQKPLALYERFVKASSNPGDIVFDPFCGCATTLVAAERLGRQWVGMDIWDGAHDVIFTRLESEGLAVRAPNPPPPTQDSQGRWAHILTPKDVHYSTAPPVRSDQGDTAAPAFITPVGRPRQRHPAPRSQHGALLIDLGPFCQGCGRTYAADPRVLEVDHIRPRSDGGSDAYDNLTLLCPPCNRLKRDRITLTGLQAENRRLGHLTPGNELNLRQRQPSRRRRR